MMPLDIPTTRVKLKLYRWICMRSPDSTSTGNITLILTTRRRTSLVCPTRSPSADTVLISSARTLLDEVRASVLVAILKPIPSCIPQLLITKGTSVKTSWRFKGDRSSPCLSLPLSPVPWRPLLRKRRQLMTHSSLIATSPKRVWLHAFSSHSSTYPILLRSLDLVASLLPSPGGDIVTDWARPPE